MRHVSALLLAFLALPLSAATPRISFWRTIPPQHDVRTSGEVAVVYALGERERVDAFVELLVAQVNDGRAFRMVDVADRSSGAKLDTALAARVRQRTPADGYLGIADVSCTTTDMKGDASAHDVDGMRIWRKKNWVQATCSATLDILSPETVKPVDSFTIKGQGISPRELEPGPHLAKNAIDSAIRYTARAAAAAMTPRRVREWIVLDADVPAFDEAMALIDTSQPERARAVWERELKTNGKSGALRFNLGAVCEALGEIRAAEEHYRAAVRMRPDESRYAIELEAFRRREGLTGRR